MAITMNVADIRNKECVSYLHDESINQRLVLKNTHFQNRYVFTCGKCGFLETFLNLL